MKRLDPFSGIPGFVFSGVAAGLKKNGVRDLGLILAKRPCTAAGVYTKNRVKAAPVFICRERLQKGSLQAVLVNSGNANACTGKQGLRDARTSCRDLAAQLNIRPGLVAPCSTGVIGVPLPAAKITNALPKLIRHASPAMVSDFAEAIMTTDTFPKIVAFQDTVMGETVRVCGIAKGAGMIMPDMATMLAFILTDAAVDPTLLSKLLTTCTEETFNRISVDGDMSTNDTVLALAGGADSTAIKHGNTKKATVLAELMQAVMHELALQIVRDGEGASKLITIDVTNARNKAEALMAARQVANSLLVKTAFFGEDFNWGRILGALGCSGATFDMFKVAVFFNDIPAVKNGQGINENLRALKKTVKQKDIRVRINLKAGSCRAEVATCDIGYEYVKINAEYTT
ncbi:MAG: bifunctional glutamate N-acetyltransferase/amino-acid acetyltransferase ArgJ [Deltaproteobacteria bacterium]|nr:bifunctional glutamate N-acetyltransferase/amino-acid acetyltransferase ArgJ [Deltaproteobacteria bacterium]